MSTTGLLAPGESPAVPGEQQWQCPVPAWRAPGTAAPNCRDLLRDLGLPSALGQSHHTRRATEEPKSPAGAEAAEWTLLNTGENTGLEETVGSMAWII